MTDGQTDGQTDRQTDGRTDGIAVACTALSIASRGKNDKITVLDATLAIFSYPSLLQSLSRTIIELDMVDNPGLQLDFRRYV